MLDNLVFNVYIIIFTVNCDLIAASRMLVLALGLSKIFFKKITKCVLFWLKKMIFSLI